MGELIELCVKILITGEVLNYRSSFDIFKNMNFYWIFFFTIKYELRLNFWIVGTLLNYVWTFEVWVKFLIMGELSGPR